MSKALDLDAIEARYSPDTIPPCRVCGAPLECGSMGGGKPTEWFCSAVSPIGKQGAERAESDRHWWASQYLDVKRGGDDEVVALVQAVRDRDAEIATLKAPVTDSDMELAWNAANADRAFPCHWSTVPEDSREFYRRFFNAYRARTTEKP